MAPAVRGEINRRDYWLNGPLEEAEAFFSDDPTAPRVVQHDAISNHSHGAAMIAIFSRNGGTVFNSGTSEWVSGLIAGDFFVCQITRNVLNRLRLK